MSIDREYNVHHQTPNNNGEFQCASRDFGRAEKELALLRLKRKEQQLQNVPTTTTTTTATTTTNHDYLDSRSFETSSKELANLRQRKELSATATPATSNNYAATIPTPFSLYSDVARSFHNSDIELARLRLKLAESTNQKKKASSTSASTSASTPSRMIYSDSLDRDYATASIEVSNLPSMQHVYDAPLDRDFGEAAEQLNSYRLETMEPFDRDFFQAERDLMHYRYTLMTPLDRDFNVAVHDRSEFMKNASHGRQSMDHVAQQLASFRSSRYPEASLDRNYTTAAYDLHRFRYQQTQQSQSNCQDTTPLQPTAPFDAPLDRDFNAASKDLANTRMFVVDKRIKSSTDGYNDRDYTEATRSMILQHALSRALILKKPKMSKSVDPQNESSFIMLAPKIAPKIAKRGIPINARIPLNPRDLSKVSGIGRCSK